MRQWKLGQYGISIYSTQLVISKTEAISNGYRTWYPFRLRWWPDFKPHRSTYDALRNLGWVRRKSFEDQGKPPWISRRRRRLYEQAVQDFALAVEDLNAADDIDQEVNHNRMQRAAEAQAKYNRYPRR